MYIFFQFWAWLQRFLFCVISKSSSFLYKKNLSSKGVSQIKIFLHLILDFKILFQTLYIFVFRRVFLVDVFN